jgi:hypothetical protein
MVIFHCYVSLPEGIAKVVDSPQEKWHKNGWSSGHEAWWFGFGIPRLIPQIPT